MTDLFTAEQLQTIKKYLDIIHEEGGHGEIVIRVRDGEIKFINLCEVSRKYCTKNN